MANADILVAGAGPAGLVAALSLARRGVRVVVFEAEENLPQDLRATTFHPPTLEMLDELGVTPSLIAQGNISSIWQFRDRRAGKIAEFDLRRIADVTPHPYRLQCEQFYLTRQLHDALATLSNATVVFNAHIEAVEQDGEGVTVEWRSNGRLERLRGFFLIGADGGRSAVRKLLPVSFDGFTYEDRLIQTGTPFDFRSVIPDLADVNYIADPLEWCVLLRIAGYWRVSFPIGPEASESQEISQAAFQHRLTALCDAGKPYELTHRKCWRIHQRVASSFRHGRIVLAGDAAHVNSPHGGMGMNSAIHDAVNLAEKLSEICLRQGSLDLLDRYSRQRKFVAMEDVRVQSMRNSQLMSERDPSIRAQRLEDMRRMADDPRRARAFLLESSMIRGLEMSKAIA